MRRARVAAGPLPRAGAQPDDPHSESRDSWVMRASLYSGVRRRAHTRMGSEGARSRPLAWAGEGVGARGQPPSDDAVRSPLPQGARTNVSVQVP